MRPTPHRIQSVASAVALLALVSLAATPRRTSASQPASQPAPSQSASSSAINTHPSKTRPLAVTYLFPEQVTIPANQSTSVDLHFKIADGLHINSHNPHTADLIPTTLSLPPDHTAPVQILNVTFPPGSDFNFTSEASSSPAPTEKLSVYTGEFTVHAQLLSAPGAHLIEARLRYQACDNQTCMPPHAIPVTIDVIAK